MVYAKNKSGDPDFDDKQPIEQHAGKLVTAPDGREVVITEAHGPVDRVTGEHVNMDEAPDARDNRPAPGEVAKEASEVQTYSAEDTPAADRPATPEDGESPEPKGTTRKQTPRSAGTTSNK